MVIDPHETYAAKFLLRQSGARAAELGFTLLADPSLTVSATYGVAFQMRIHTEWSNRPTTFLVDQKGVLRYARRAKTYADRPTPEQILAELQKLNQPTGK